MAVEPGSVAAENPEVAMVVAQALEVKVAEETRPFVLVPAG
ncbi:MAG: hypothetical protein SFV15_02940 [Polyangiaceae bacterium]|nr:hypothetical protein [Polyangiaceae bacterium]